MSTSGIELTKELRLRRWARANYCPAKQRSATWHPVVLDEMRCRDVELADQTGHPPRAFHYVPLPPTEIVEPRSGSVPEQRRDAASSQTEEPLPPPHVYF